MKKFSIIINGTHTCYMAAKAKREALANVKASQEQKVGVLWDKIKNFPMSLPVSAIDCGEI